ncbi:MAG: hypothetical protein LC109_03160 [Bacteroidia bacterium]|nr:hypothetical protein [Bacteroidia bacterium]
MRNHPQNIAQNRYPFGMTMVGYSNPDYSYKYSFNGMEKDDEVKGSGNSLDFGARIYDSRLGRWLSVDPLMSIYPSLSPYHGIGNNPILFKDADGRKILLLHTGNNDVEWKKFKSITENRFKGMVSISRVKYATPYHTYDEHGTIISTQLYWEVKMNFNDAEIHSQAVKRIEARGEEATPDLIRQEESVIKAEIENDYAYATLDKMISSDVRARFNLFSSSPVLASFAGENDGLQQINIDLVLQLRNMYKGASFNILFHELVEGHEFTNQKAIGGDISYGHSHLKAIEAQTLDLNTFNGNKVLWAFNEFVSTSGVGNPNSNDRMLEVTIYTQSEDGKYYKTTGEIRIVNGQVQGVVSATANQEITKEQYESEKNTQDQKAKSH